MDCLINKRKINMIFFYFLMINALLFSANASAISTIDGVWESTSRIVGASPECLFNSSQLSALQINNSVLGNITITSNQSNQTATIIDGNNTFNGVLNGDSFNYSGFLDLKNVIMTLTFNNGVLSGNSTSSFAFGCRLDWTITGRQISSITSTAPSSSQPELNPILNLQPGQFISSNSFVEPNNTTDQATPLLVNDKPLYQLLDNVDQVDWFEFRAVAGKRYTIEILGTSIGNNINPAFQLYDKAGNTLTDLLTRETRGQNISLEIILPKSDLYQIRVINQAPFSRRIEVDNQYQIRIFLTDQPQQGIIKGYVLNTCSKNGVNEAEVSSLLNGIINDSTLTFSTGEFGLPLNPDIYKIQSIATNYQDETIEPVRVTLENITQIQLNQKPIGTCENSKSIELSPILQEQQAVAVYNDKIGILTIRDAVVNNLVFYAELKDIGNFRFELSRYYQIPGTIHATPVEYDTSTGIANLPAVFAFGKTWKAQIMNDSNWVFSIIKIAPK